MLRIVMLLIVILAPAVFRVWSGYRLRRLAPEAATAEHWLAHSLRGTQVTVAGIVVAASFWPEAIYGSVPMILVASTAAEFPTRRVLFRETWSFSSYMAWSTRLYLAFAAFWTLFVFTPVIVSDVGGRRWWVAAALGAVLLIWSTFYQRLARRLLGARPLDQSDMSVELAAGLARVAEASTARNIRVWRAGPPGGLVANALALPDARTPSALLSESLLEALTAREVIAIFAHEVAHLEYYSPARLRRMHLTSWPLYLCAVLWAPVVHMIAPSAAAAANLLWVVVALTGLAMRGQRQQAHESDSDRRAVELCGDAEALASGLVKIHVLSRLPRRWSPAFEQHATHPSLATRLRAIRGFGQAGEPEQAAVEPVIVQSAADPGTWVVVDRDRVRFLQGVAAGADRDVSGLACAASSAASIAYGELTDLRVAPGGPTGTLLRIVDRQNVVRTCAIAPGDVARVQTALDAVDRLVPRRAPLDGALWLLTAITLIASMIVSLQPPYLLSLMSVVGLSLLRPTAASLFGAAAAVLAALLTIEPGDWTFSPALLRPVLFLLCGGALVYLARRWRTVRPAEHESQGRVLFLVAATVVCWLVAVLPSSNLIMLSRIASSLPGLVFFPAAAAATLWSMGPRRRRAAIGATAFALAGVFVTSPVALRRAVRDPLIVPMPRFEEVPLTLRTDRSVDAPDNPGQLRLSPGATRYMVVKDFDEEAESDEPYEFVAGTFEDGGIEAFRAQAAEFIDDAHVLAVTRAGVQWQLLRRDLEARGQPELVYEAAADDAPQLLVDAASRSWHLRLQRGDRLVRVEGRDADAPRTVSWHVDSGGGVWWSAGRGEVLIGTRASYGGYQSRWWAIPFAFGITSVPWATDVFGMDPQSTSPRLVAGSHQQVQCLDGSPASDALCIASDGTVTRVWHATAAGLRPAGEIAVGTLHSQRLSRDRIAIWTTGGTRLVDLRAKQVIRVEGGARTSSEWASGGDVLGAIDWGQGQPRILRFAAQPGRP